MKRRKFLGVIGIIGAGANAGMSAVKDLLTTEKANKMATKGEVIIHGASPVPVEKFTESLPHFIKVSEIVVPAGGSGSQMSIRVSKDDMYEMTSKLSGKTTFKSYPCVGDRIQLPTADIAMIVAKQEGYSDPDVLVISPMRSDVNLDDMVKVGDLLKVRKSKIFDPYIGPSARPAELYAPDGYAEAFEMLDKKASAKLFFNKD